MNLLVFFVQHISCLCLAFCLMFEMFGYLTIFFLFVFNNYELQNTAF